MNTWTERLHLSSFSEVLEIYVTVHRAGLRKRGIAVLACEGSYLCMDPLVCDQVRFLFKNHAAFSHETLVIGLHSARPAV